MVKKPRQELGLACPIFVYTGRVGWRLPNARWLPEIVPICFASWSYVWYISKLRPYNPDNCFFFWGRSNRKGAVEMARCGVLVSIVTVLSMVISSYADWCPKLAYARPLVEVRRDFYELTNLWSLTRCSSDIWLSRLGRLRYVVNQDNNTGLSDLSGHRAHVWRRLITRWSEQIFDQFNIKAHPCSTFHHGSPISTSNFQTKIKGAS